MKKNTYTIPLALVFCLFFLWAISSNLLPTMIRQLMKTCELNTFEAALFPCRHTKRILGLPLHLFCHCHRNVFSGDGCQSVCNSAGCL